MTPGTWPWRTEVSAPAGRADARLDALALAEARLRRDRAALACLLDTGDNRAQAAELAQILALFLATWCPDPLAALAELRAVLLAG